MVHDGVPTPELREQLRQLLTQQDSAACDDATLDRLLRADKGHVKTAAARLSATLQWRRETRPETLRCSTCVKDCRSHYMRPVGFTKAGQPVLYSCGTLASDRSYKGNREHMIQSFEQAIRLMPPSVERWVWFADLAGFGVRDMSPSLGHSFLDLASKHYAERLQTFYLVAAPSIFSVLFNSIWPFVDHNTREKIKFLPYDVHKSNSKLRAEVEGVFEASCAAWILEEMAQNRDKQQLKKKQYCQEEVYQSLCAGEEAQHVWGCTELVHKLQKQPTLLQLESAEPAQTA